MLQAYQVEFFTIALIHLLAVASPGPDFAIVLRHSVLFGRRAALITSVGIGLAILLHVAYSLLGIGLLIQTTPWIFHTLTIMAAGYLAFIGFSALKSSASKQSVHQSSQHQHISDKKAFLRGFLTNGLNPKATLFFLSLFAVVISKQTPLEVKLFYGGYLATATGVWFCLLSCFLSYSKVRNFISAKGYWFDRIMGVLLVTLAAKLVFDSLVK
ncbi:LysE family translocator [Neptunicella marina]|uniref:LysE family translocator n=1 Tax=Neptunicella marina TaxID=2125989 RepID=A0A8J6IWS5_9ALTE|nr:LysE family translocator [Neptunicella marina]MBC3766931.1 LysE family translocator [Neptunicella marina]